jgi:hypothetical protein
MLRFFGGDVARRLNGICFEPTKLKCMILDDFHLSLLAHYCAAEWERDFHEEYGWLRRLGHSDQHTRQVMGDSEFFELMPPGVDALLFPWAVFEFGVIHAHSHKGEAEVSLLQPCCEKLWVKRQVYSVLGEYYEVEEDEDAIRALDRRGRN